MSMLGRYQAIGADEVRDRLARDGHVGTVLHDHGGGVASCCLELHNAWRYLHWLLTGTEWDGEPPLDFILGGGRVVPSGSQGELGARWIEPPEAQRIADALDLIAPEQLAERYDPNSMDFDEELLEDLTGYYAALRGFVQRAVSQRLGLLFLVF